VSLADARYATLGVIGEGGRLAEFVPVGLSELEISKLDHWPRGEGILGLMIREPGRCGWPTWGSIRSLPASGLGTRRCAPSSECAG
jgi:hypothetical protein